MNKLSVEVIEYNRCSWTVKRMVMHCMIGVVFFFVMGMIFFNNAFMAVLACSLVYFYMKEKKLQTVAKRKALLLDQFKEGMYALTSALSAGKSVEQAFISSLNDLKIVYTANEDIIIEWQNICHKLVMNEPIESAFADFAKRSGLEDIDNFSNVFVLAKRSGGNLVDIIEETSRLISDKIDIQKEIDILIVQKQFEQKILAFIIPGMILFFAVVSPDFLEPLYTTVGGRCVMVIALLMYIVAQQIGKKIVAIEV